MTDFYGGFCTFTVCNFFLGVFMVIGVRQLNLTVDTIGVSQIDKFEIDWTKEFINDIYAVDATESCKDQDEPVLQMPWFGL